MHVIATQERPEPVLRAHGNGRQISEAWQLQGIIGLSFCFEGHANAKLRTAAQALDVYRAGMEFLRHHKTLHMLAMRPATHS